MVLGRDGRHKHESSAHGQLFVEKLILGTWLIAAWKEEAMVEGIQYVKMWRMRGQNFAQKKWSKKTQGCTEKW